MSEICGMELCAPRSVERGGGSSGEFSSGFCPRGGAGICHRAGYSDHKGWPDCGVPRRHDEADVWKRGKNQRYTYEELQQFHLGDSTEKIPLLREVLQTVDGRVPLLIEIKMPGLSTAVCAGFQKEMEGYTGMFCMESFNSLALRWCRRHMPQTLRGQLSGRFSKDDKVHLILRIMARHLMLNFIGKPDFIAYDHRYADCPGFLIDRMLFRTPAFAWTVKDEHVYNRTRKKFDAAIFEHFHPKDGFQKPMNCFLKNNKAY